MNHTRKILFAICLIALLGAALLWWSGHQSARHALKIAALELAPDKTVPLAMSPLKPETPEGLRYFCDQRELVDAAPFGSNLALVSPGAVFVVSREGERIAEWNALNGLSGEPRRVVGWGEDAAVATSDGLLLLTGGDAYLYRAGFASIDDVRDVAARDDELLLATGNGIHTFARGAAQYGRHQLAEGGALPGIALIEALPDATAIGVSDTGELYSLAFDRLVKEEAPAVPGDYPPTLLEEFNGELYLGFGPALYRRGADGRFVELETPVIATALAALETPAGTTLLAATHGSGIATLAGDGVPPPFLREGKGSLPLVSALITDGRELFAATGEGLMRFNGGWEELDGWVESPLPGNHVSALHLTEDGELYAGAFIGGLTRYSESMRPVREYRERFFGQVNHVAPLGEERLAVSTTSGAALMSGGESYLRLTEADGLIGRNVAFVAPYMSDEFLCTAKGVSLRREGRIESWYALHGLVNNHAYCAAGFNGRMYVGTLGGISVFDNGRFTHSYTVGDSELRSEWVSALIVSGDYLYVGTYGGGLCRIDGQGELMHLKLDPDEFVVNPNALAAEGDRLLIGTLKLGLLVYDTRTGETLESRLPLPSANVTSLATDGSRYYIGTERGLLLADRERLEESIDEEI